MRTRCSSELTWPSTPPASSPPFRQRPRFSLIIAQFFEENFEPDSFIAEGNEVLCSLPSATALRVDARVTQAEGEGEGARGAQEGHKAHRRNGRVDGLYKLQAVYCC